MVTRFVPKCSKFSRAVVKSVQFNEATIIWEIRFLSNTANNQIRFNIEVDWSETHGALCERFLNGSPMPCFLGISPDTSFSNRRRLTSILEWLNPKATEIVLLDGSYFGRWDAIVFRQLSALEAATSALREIRRLEDRITSIADELGMSEKIKPLPWPEILEKPAVRDIQWNLRTYARKDVEFAEDVESVLEEFLQRAHPEESASLSIPERETLCNYVYEELSVFLYLAVTSWPLEVYPGSDLPIMQRIANGEFTGFPISCPQRSHLSIRLIPLETK